METVFQRGGSTWQPETEAEFWDPQELEELFKDLPSVQLRTEDV